MREAVLAMLDASRHAGTVTLLLSSREAEAAKCLADRRVALVVAIDDVGIRRTLASLGHALPVVWATESDTIDGVIARVAAELETVSSSGQRGTSA